MLFTIPALALKKMSLNVFFATFSMAVNQQARDTPASKQELIPDLRNTKKRIEA